MAKNTRGVTRFPSEIEPESLSIAVTTLVIDGKRITSAFYKQITESDLVEEGTGELRGSPLGYFHLHTKSCPEIMHTHVLWGTETELNLATVLSLEKDERYQQQEQRSLQQQERLIHLLALLLGLAGHPHTVEWVGQDERKLTIAGYTLYVNEHTVHQLKKLQLAREQQLKDEEAWQVRQASDEGSDLVSASPEAQRAAAEAILAQLDQLGIELKHPARDKIEGNELAVHGYYGDDAEYGPLGWQTTWVQYPALSEGGVREEPLLYWRAKDRQQRRQQVARFSQAVETLLTPRHSACLLRWFFAENMVREQLNVARRSAEFLVERADIAALLQHKPRGAKAGKKESPSISSHDLDPDQVWGCYERESKRFKAFTQRWKDSLEHIRSVPQLFLVS
jgi:hypothetical protein